MGKKGVFIRMMNRWDYKTHTYLKWAIPAEWKVVLTCEDMEEKVNCCQCGREVEFGNTYSSQEVQNDYGLGYATCEECHNKEMERRLSDEF